jgi:glutathione S-transferase
LPTDPRLRAQVISWLFGAFNTVEPVMFEFTNVTVFARGEEWAKLRRPSLEEFIRRRLAPLETRLATQDWLGNDFSVADIAMVTVLRAMDGSSLMAEHPAVAAYVVRGMARPAFERAMADQLAAFDRHPAPQMQGA